MPENLDSDILPPVSNKRDSPCPTHIHPSLFTQPYMVPLWKNAVLAFCAGASGFNGHPNDRPNWYPGPHPYNAYNPMEHQAPSMNVGTRDIGQVPNTMLIVVDLPPMINESHVWNSLKQLGPLKRVMMVKDRQSRISWGFCFAEFEDIKVRVSTRAP